MIGKLKILLHTNTKKMSNQGNLLKGIVKCSGWFSVGICKYKLGYESHNLLWIWVLSLVENSFKKNPFQDLVASLKAVISTNERTLIITGHVIYDQNYTYKFQLKTTQVWLDLFNLSLLNQVH